MFSLQGFVKSKLKVNTMKINDEIVVQNEEYPFSDNTINVLIKTLMSLHHFDTINFFPR
jgi:hypothetical protein